MTKKTIEEKYIQHEKNVKRIVKKCDDLEKQHKEIQEKSLEIRLKNTLDRRGYTLKKNRRRDPLAVDYGGYSILDNTGKPAAEGSLYNGRLTLKEVEEWVDNMGKGE
jgi:hypothetical protein